MKKTDLFITAIRIVVAGLFVTSGFIKLVEPYENFVGVIIGYQIVGVQTAETIALVFPWVEFLAGLFLLFGLWTRFSAVVLWALNTALVAVVVSALFRAIPVTDCGCFGGGAHLSLQQVLLLDVTLWCFLYVLVRVGKRASALGFDEIL